MSRVLCYWHSLHSCNLLRTRSSPTGACAIFLSSMRCFHVHLDYKQILLFAPMQWSVLLPVVLALVANQEGDSFATKLGDYCYTKWALEAFLLANAERFENSQQYLNCMQRNFGVTYCLCCRYSGVWLIQRCGAIRQRGYDLKDYYPCLAYLVATGIFSRGVAFFCLVTFQKK